MKPTRLAALAIAAPWLTAHAATPAAPAAPAKPTAQQVCASLPAVQTLLPCGAFHVVKSQILSQDGAPVRLNCTAWWMDLPNYDQQMLTVVLAGFNCLRVSYFNATLASDLAAIDRTVAAAAKVGIRVIVNNHANDGGGNCVAQQANGLWFDNPGGDGCGGSSTTDAKWLADWQAVARHYQGTPTVIGYDLWNEPLEAPNGTPPLHGATWGGGGQTDILAAYTRAGNAILALDPDKLIIAEGPITWAPLYGADLTHVAAMPLTLAVPGRVVYSAHVYPAEIGGMPFDTGPQYIATLNRGWGDLITQDIAPVWVGEIGASMNSADGKAWADGITAYINGTAPGGLRVPAGGQPPGTDWWMWDTLAGGLPNGALKPDQTTPRPEQAAVYAQFIQQKTGTPPPASGAAPATTDAYARQVAAVATDAAPPPSATPAQASPPSAPTADAPVIPAAEPVSAAQIDQLQATIDQLQAQINALKAAHGVP